MEWYLKVLKNYSVFNGRARRKEYWMFCLFNIIFSYFLGFIDGSTGTMDMDSGYGLLSGIYTFAVLLPSIAVTVRRMHDVGRSGWFQAIPLINLVWLCEQSDNSATNKF